MYCSSPKLKSLKNSSISSSLSSEVKSRNESMSKSSEEITFETVNDIYNTKMTKAAMTLITATIMAMTIAAVSPPERLAGLLLYGETVEVTGC